MCHRFFETDFMFLIAGNFIIFSYNSMFGFFVPSLLTQQLSNCRDIFLGDRGENVIIFYEAAKSLQSS